MFSALVFVGLIISKVFGSYQLADNCRVFCQGPLLEAVQNAHLFDDSKHFVDMPLKHTPEITLNAFEQLENKSDVQTIKNFVETYFLPPGTELQICHPADWVPAPKNFEKILDAKYREWAYSLHFKWKSLCRRIKDNVTRNPQYYSLITVPYPFIAPGGRFRELYYWDTYWIIKGLLASEMLTTAKNMIRNLGYMVRKYGFVPNGARVYYLGRSQPPLLAGCLMEYFNATGDLDFIKEMIPLLDKEYQYWIKERTINWTTGSGDSYQLFQYRIHQDSPRPESYKEDILSVTHLANETDKVQMWSEIAASCESGWDFSSRWFAKEGPYKNNLRSIRTSRIIPVDLNSFMCWNSVILFNFHSIVGNTSAAEGYKNQYKLMKTAMANVFWNEEDGVWYDLDLDTQASSRYYYLSNPTPLFGKCVDNIAVAQKRIVDYLKLTNAANHPGGLPTSNTFTGEQWDSPNGWAPTNHIVIDGLRNSENQQVREAAFELADKWIKTNYFAYVRSGGKMFEKYNVESYKSQAGGGGEYEVQEGFGWTNGVVLDLLLHYGDRLIAPSTADITTLI